MSCDWLMQFSLAIFDVLPSVRFYRHQVYSCSGQVLQYKKCALHLYSTLSGPTKVCAPVMTKYSDQWSQLLSLILRFQLNGPHFLLALQVYMCCCVILLLILGFRVQGVGAWSQYICACMAYKSFISHQKFFPQDSGFDLLRIALCSVLLDYVVTQTSFCVGV